MIKIVTHDGLFHTDEIFAVAFLRLCYPNSKVIRTRDITPQMEMDKDTFLVDVSNPSTVNSLKYNPELNNFDHHMNDKRVEGLSSFGLVMDKFNHVHPDSYIYKSVLNEEERMFVYKNILTNLVGPIDDWDNANVSKDEKILAIQTMFKWLNNNVNDAESQFNSFMVCVDMATNFIKGAIKVGMRVYQSMVTWRTREVIDQYIAVLNDFCITWTGMNNKEEVPHKFIVFPENEDCYVVLSADSELYPIIVNEDPKLIFAHHKRFIAKFKTLSSAVDCAKNSL